MRQLMAQHAALRRGGMTFGQLKYLLQCRARARGFKLDVKLIPWQYSGMLQRIRGRIWIIIDSEQSPADQVRALAHEAGHLLFKHYEIDDEVWTLQEGPGGDEWEWEADFFAAFATRTPGTPAEWFLNEQLKLKV